MFEGIGNGDASVARAAALNTDSGSAWSGFGTFTDTNVAGGTHLNSSNAFFSLGSAKMMWMGDDEGGDRRTFHPDPERCL